MPTYPRNWQWSSLMAGQTTHKLATTGSYAAHSEMLRTEKGRRKGTESTQYDKPLDGSRDKAPSE